MFNTAQTACYRLPDMATEDFLRMMLAASEFKGITGEVKIARLLNVSEQVVNNWKRRGLPRDKVIDIAKSRCLRFYGHAPVYHRTPHPLYTRRGGIISKN